MLSGSLQWKGYGHDSRSLLNRLDGCLPISCGSDLLNAQSAQLNIHSSKIPCKQSAVVDARITPQLSDVKRLSREDDETEEAVPTYEACAKPSQASPNAVSQTTSAWDGRPIARQLVEPRPCSCAPESPPGLARTLAPALSSDSYLLHLPACLSACLTSPAAASPDRSGYLPHTSSALTTPTTMSGAVATARPTQALRVRRESQRPGVARVVTKTNNMEDEAAKPEPKLYGMRHPVRVCVSA